MTEKAKKKSNFEEIWDNLYNLDVSEHIEEKMNLSFLSWGVVYTLMVQNYPDFKFGSVDYDGCPFLRLPDGTAQVTTWVEVNGEKREMTLPVMDNRMKTTTNLDSNTINKSVWRCFVKNCAMFGLGMKLYSQMKDDISEIGEENPETKPEAGVDQSLATEQEALTPQEDGYPTDQAIDDLKFQEESGVDETISNETKEGSLKLFATASVEVAKSSTTKKEITEYFTNNSDQFKELKTILPDEYDKLINTIKEIQQKLGE